MRVPLLRSLLPAPLIILSRTGVDVALTRVRAANDGARMRSIHRLFALVMVAWVPTALSAPAPVSAPRKIVLIAGKKSHGPEGNGIHDYPWSVRLLKVLLDRSNIRDQVRVEMVFDGWPKEEGVLENADTTVVLSDGRDGDKFEEAPHFANPGQMQTMRRQVERGCGFGTFHFSTFAPEVYREEILSWSGGYFQWETEGKRRWYSAIKVLDADLGFPNPDHAALRGVRPFRLKEEFYYNLRFNPEDRSLVPLLAVPALPGRDPDGRWVAWAKERPDGGRGFGTTCGHFYENWRNDDFRKLMLNVIAWSAWVNVPVEGVESAFVERDEILKALASAQPQ
jgi:type 1 glutamine amidotransferase